MTLSHQQSQFNDSSSSHSEYAQQEGQPDSFNRIKRINEELEALAKKKEEALFKEEQLDYIFKKQQPSLALSDFAKGSKEKEAKDKKYRIRAVVIAEEWRFRITDSSFSPRLNVKMVSISICGCIGIGVHYFGSIGIGR